MEQAERAFQFDELFFSRTNERGIIQSGNPVFKRISGFDWGDLLDKPHSLIRHPDMPRGVFYLLWNYLKGGKSIGAYVKNRARTGEYYWVFALAFPVDQGYVSLRLKPSSKYFHVTQNLYKRLLEIEKSENISPKESMSLILDQLNVLDFPTYDEFMAETLVSELQLRNHNLQKTEIPVLRHLQRLVSNAKTVSQLAVKVGSIYNQYTRVPLNMEILTSRIGDDGAPLSIVARNYEKMVKEIQSKIVEFLNLNVQVTTSVGRSQFQVASSFLQKEMVGYFRTEKDLGPIDPAKEMHYLTTLQQKGLDEARSVLVFAGTTLESFRSSCEDLKQISLGLEIVRLTGKIEASKVLTRIPEVSHLLDELLEFKSSLQTTIGELEQLSRQMLECASGISPMLGALACHPQRTEA